MVKGKKLEANDGRHAPLSQAARDFDVVRINFDPYSETLDDDYEAFHRAKKSLPATDAETIEDRFQDVFTKQRELQRRFVNNVFLFWTVCADGACKRNKGCAGDPYACHQRWWPWTPERHKAHYRAYVRARADGDSHEDASKYAKAEVKRLAEHIAWVEAGQDARLATLEAAERIQGADGAIPAQRKEAAMPAAPMPRDGYRGPRVSLL